jgi:cobalt transporter subunit CbtB
MTTTTRSASAVEPSLVAILATAAIGLAIIVFTGHLQAQTLHAAAHDTRHATGFPCH